MTEMQLGGWFLFAAGWLGCILVAYNWNREWTHTKKKNRRVRR